MIVRRYGAKNIGSEFKALITFEHDDQTIQALMSSDEVRELATQLLRAVDHTDNFNSIFDEET
jgi:hypothetical protein